MMMSVTQKASRLVSFFTGRGPGDLFFLYASIRNAIPNSTPASTASINRPRKTPTNWLLIHQPPNSDILAQEGRRVLLHEYELPSLSN